MYDGFSRSALGLDHHIWVGDLPDRLRFGVDEFEALWNLHPDNYPEIHLHGRMVRTPRWQQAYGADYQFSGRVYSALAVPPMLHPVHNWCRDVIDSGLNGLLVNWYDGQLGHYIGKHRDSTKGMRASAPIVTVSFGESRVFRVRPWKRKGGGFIDCEAHDGTVLIVPYATNLAWTHEVPARARLNGRRISVTLRAFNER